MDGAAVTVENRGSVQIGVSPVLFRVTGLRDYFQPKLPVKLSRMFCFTKMHQIWFLSLRGVSGLA